MKKILACIALLLILAGIGGVAAVKANGPAPPPSCSPSCPKCC